MPPKSSRAVERIALSVIAVIPGERANLRLETPALLMTIEASIAQLGTPRLKLTLDRSGFCVAPSNTRIALDASTQACRVAVLGLGEPLFESVALLYEKLGFKRDKLDRWLGRVALLPRTVWIHEIVHRYVFERYALDEHDNEATRFLESEILKEIYYVFRDREDGADRATLVREYSPCVSRAVSYVEAHLFEPGNVRALAKAAGASTSTLLRSFRSELGCSPGAYWRRRKLDEALVLLRAGRHSVSEVALAIGYDNPTAFAHAFRIHYGHPPSWFRPRRRSRPAPS